MSRKRIIILIQFIIFLTASFLLYNTYLDNTYLEKNERAPSIVKVGEKTNPDLNSFSEVEYSGFDLNGNRYMLNAGVADFKTETPELINMKEVVANFYLKDGNILKVESKEGLYNNITLDMKFRKNVRAVYLTNTLLSDLLTYSNNTGKLLATGNVHGESVEKGEFFADNVEYDLESKALNFSMIGNKQVNVKLKN